mgnify:CR=1 FL=1
MLNILNSIKNNKSIFFNKPNRLIHNILILNILIFLLANMAVSYSISQNLNPLNYIDNLGLNSNFYILIKKKIIDFMKILIPFTPHLAHECLEQLGETEIDKWPDINNKEVLNEIIKIAIQINGKTREIIEIKKDLDENSVITESKKPKKISNYLQNKKIIKTIFVKNKIINYLIK